MSDYTEDQKREALVIADEWEKWEKDNNWVSSEGSACWASIALANFLRKAEAELADLKSKPCEYGHLQAKAEKERDEALARIEVLQAKYDHAQEEGSRLIGERDEARSKAKELELDGYTRADFLRALKKVGVQGLMRAKVFAALDKNGKEGL